MPQFDATRPARATLAGALCERVAFIRDGRLLDERVIRELIARHGGRSLDEAYTAAMR